MRMVDVDVDVVDLNNVTDATRREGGITMIGRKGE